MLSQGILWHDHVMFSRGPGNSSKRSLTYENCKHALCIHRLLRDDAMTQLVNPGQPAAFVLGPVERNLRSVLHLHLSVCILRLAWCHDV